MTGFMLQLLFRALIDEKSALFIVCDQVTNSLPALPGTGWRLVMRFDI
jgi:hypothetical protein